MAEEQSSQKENCIPIYLQKLAKAIESAPLSSPVLSPQISRMDEISKVSGILETISRDLKTSEEKGQKVRQAVKDNPDLGMKLIDDEMLLFPVNAVKVREVLRSHSLNNHTLEHTGYAYAYGVDNIAQVRQFGVFGGKNKSLATFLKSLGSGMKTNEVYEIDQIKNPVRLIVDIGILNGLRSIFTDPEPTWSNLQSDIVGESYFVLGGIPAKAITRVEYGQQFIQIK